MVLANGLVVGSLSSDYWENNIDNSIELDASKFNIINNQIQLQIASGLDGNEFTVLPDTATILMSYVQNSGLRSGTTRTGTVKPAIDAFNSGYNCVALKSDGTVWAWGYNYYGQLGNGTKTDSSIPVQIRGLAGISAINACTYYAIALKTDGTVWAWGANNFGQLGNGTETDSSIPVQVTGLTNVSAIAAGFQKTLADIHRLI